MLIRPGQLAETVLLLAIGLVGSLLALSAGLPMPFLLGSLVSTAIFSIIRMMMTGGASWFPQPFRKSFVAVIGVMIGATFSTDILAIVPTLWLSLGAMMLFVPTSFFGSYLIFRTIGRYDRPTAIFCAMPGGLVEAVELGERAGGNVQTLSVQHFARIVLVVVIIPLGFLVFSGETVGSAAGQTLSRGASGFQDIFLIVAAVPIGMALGPRLRVPAPHLMGPLLLSAICHATGMVEIHSPVWLLYLAQLVVGSGLGASFSGASIRVLGRALALGILSVSLTLLIGVVFASGLDAVMALDFAALFISFAPGGITEMNLIALSLGISPVIVATHHLFRIVLTVAFASAVWKRVRNLPV